MKVTLLRRLLFSTVVMMMACSHSLADMGWTRQLQTETKLFEVLKKRPAPQIFVQTEDLTWTRSSPPSTIVYGNEKIGYFESKNFKTGKNKLTLRFIPPTYKSPLQFWAHSENGSKINLKTKQFVNPLGGLTETTTEINGEFSFPFILLNGTSRSIPMVLNRFGEVVWLLDTQKGLNLKQPDTSGLEILEDGEFLFMAIGEFSRLHRVDSFGKVIQEINFRDKNIRYPSNHTVQYLKKTNEILFLSNDCRTLSAWDEFIPLFQGPAGWLRLFTLPRRSYKGSKLIRMSLTTLKAREIWNTFQDYSPNKNPSLATGQLAVADRFMDARTKEQYQTFLTVRDFSTWSNFPDEHCNVDWSHENSAQYIEGKGYLISIRNLNQIIFLDESGKRQWNIGEGSGHTYNLPMDSRSFSLQHAARMQENGQILIYDNHIAYRGFSGSRFANRLVLLEPKVPGEITPVWSFEILTPQSEIRGSATVLPDERIFSYTAGNPGVPSDFLEVDIGTKAVLGQLRYNMLQGNKGFEAKPLFSFGGDKYLGPGQTTSPAKMPAPQKDSDFLQFTY